MVRFLISRPIAVIMTFIGVLMLGIVSYRLLPVALMPNIDIPTITVQLNYPSCSAREIENTITKVLRAQLMQVAHLCDINSETSDGLATIRLSFDYGTSVDYAFIEVNEKIDGAMNSLPKDVARPKVTKASANDLPVSYLNVSFKKNSFLQRISSPNASKFIELSEFCENVIIKRIEQLSVVAMVDKSGTTSPEILIKPDKQKMESMHITFDQIQLAVNNCNFSPGNIMVRDGNYEYFIKFTSYLKTPSDIENIYIRAQDKILQLKDIAKVIVQPQKQQGLFLFNNDQAITMAIIQQAGVRMSDLKKDINKLVEYFRSEYPSLNFEITRDQSQLLDFSISNLIQDLVMGAIMAFLLLFIFLNDLKAPVLIGITVPMSLIISLLFFRLFNLSLNIISLAGLALGLGMIIDCSIIVIENILYHRHLGSSLTDSCVRGTNEVIRPMLSSTLTTSAVFMPLIFLSGMAGALFYDEAVSVSIGNGASFIVSITVLPVMFMLFYKNKNNSKLSQRRKIKKGYCFLDINTKTKFFLNKLNVSQKTERWYENGIYWVFRNKRLTFIIFLISIFSAVLLFKVVKKEKFPAFKQTELLVNIDWNENIPLDINQKRVKSLINHVNHNLQQSSCLIGEQQFILKQEPELDYYQAELYLKMKTPDLVQLVKDTLQFIMQNQYPMAKVSFKQPETIFERIFPNSEAPLLAKISVNLAQERDPCNWVQFATELDSLVGTAIPNNIPVKQQLAINIDQERLLLYGVDYFEVYKSVVTAFNQNKFSDLRSYQHFMPIILGEDSRLVNDVFLARKVKNYKGDEFPISTFVSIYRLFDLKYITANQEGEYIPLRYYPSQNNVQEYKSRIQAFARKKHQSDVQFAGSLSNNSKMFRELSIILVISVLLLYFILAAQFESLWQPLIVLLEIPVDIASALFLLWFFGNSLNVMSAIGIIIMCGVIINDSILKVDTINRLHKGGLSIMDAIMQGGKMRLGSILMTALTTIFAVLPFFWGSDMGSTLQRPLALALIGGMTVGTFVSLFFVPLAYWTFHKKAMINSDN